MAGFTPWTAISVSRAIVHATRGLNPQVTDFTQGAVLRSTVAEPVAIVAEALGQDIVAASDQNMQVTLQKAFEIIPANSSAAYGAVLFTVPTAPSSQTSLPQGFTVAIPSSTLQFTVGATTLWAAGTTTLDVVVTCSQAGSVGNVPASSITQIVSAVPSGLSGLTVTNLNDFTTGRDAETPLDATAQVPLKLAQLKAATGDACAAKAIDGTVQNNSGQVTEAVGAAVSTSGGYVPTPAQAPSLSVSSPASTTTLASGTYSVAYTWTTADGETPPSPLGATTIASGQAIVVAALTLPNIGNPTPTPTATGVRYYLSQAAGTSSVAWVASGTGSHVTLSVLPANGASSPPSVNTAFADTPGYATVWIANDVGTTPSSALLQSAQQQVDGYTDSQGVAHPGASAAGIRTGIVAAQLVTQAVTVAILPAPGFSLPMVQDSVTYAIDRFFSHLDIGDGIRLNSLIQDIVAVVGVSDCTLSVPSSNVSGRRGVLYRVGTVTQTLMS